MEKKNTRGYQILVMAEAVTLIIADNQLNRYFLRKRHTKFRVHLLLESRFLYRLLLDERL